MIPRVAQCDLAANGAFVTIDNLRVSVLWQFAAPDIQAPSDETPEIQLAGGDRLGADRSPPCQPSRNRSLAPLRGRRWFMPGAWAARAVQSPAPVIGQWSCLIRLEEMA